MTAWKPVILCKLFLCKKYIHVIYFAFVAQVESLLLVTFEPLQSLATVHHVNVPGYMPYLSSYEMTRDYGEHWKTRISVSVSMLLPDSHRL